MLHFVHIRKRSTSFLNAGKIINQEVFVAKQNIEVKGGATVGYTFDDDNKRLLFTTARCSKKDNYCKRTGRELVAERTSKMFDTTSPKVIGVVNYSEFPEGKASYKNIASYFYNLLKD